jgi:DNA-binding NtrC family response regulator
MNTLNCELADLPLDPFAIARQFARAAEPSRTRARSPAASNALEHLRGVSAAMKALREIVARVAPTSASVLVTGESGSGKELVATAIHEASPRAQQPFIAINCGALPANLVEAELFGYEKGAFTGAVRAHQGCFERASGGTLFLDEITEMPLELQVTLLRALETGRFCRVGSAQEISVDVRVIAATNREPATVVANGTLLEDLLYRLAVFPIRIPALRERGEDIELLAQHFLDELNAHAGTAKRLSDGARAFLHSHSWPGNVRELKNAVQRAFILGDEALEFGGAVAAQPAFTQRGDALQFRIGTALEEIEREVIFATLAHC